MTPTTLEGWLDIFARVNNKSSMLFTYHKVADKLDMDGDTFYEESHRYALLSDWIERRINNKYGEQKE